MSLQTFHSSLIQRQAENIYCDTDIGKKDVLLLWNNSFKNIKRYQ